jgi:hypothetical protein
MDDDLSVLGPIARVIARRLAERPEHFITHPSEMKLFRSLTAEQLSEFARCHGWRVVRRVGGRRIEFYNDVGAKVADDHATR